MSEDFVAWVQSERERLNGYREQYTAVIADATRSLDEIDREFAAIKAYESAKTGKTAATNTGAAPRARRGSRREDIIRAVSAAPLGMTRGELLEMFGVKGDKAGEMSVSNALTALSKSNQVRREGGRYHAAAQEFAAAAE